MNKRIIACLLLVFFIGTYNVIIGLAEQTWYDPVGNTPTAGSMIADTVNGISLLNFENREAEYSTVNSTSTKVIYILINPALLDKITADYPNPQTNANNFLRNYINELAKTYDVITFAVVPDALSPEQLKYQLSIAYQSVKDMSNNTEYGKLVGCLFIGDLPQAWFEYDSDFDGAGRQVFPCDLYFMELDGIYLDGSSKIQDINWHDNMGWDSVNNVPTTTPNRIFEDHTDINDPSYINKLNLIPDIWVGRLPVQQFANGADDTAKTASAVEILRKYLAKNLQFRKGQLKPQYKNLCYIDEWEFQVGGVNQAGIELKKGYGDGNVVSFDGNGGATGDADVTDKEHFKSYLGTNYEWVHATITSSSSYHTFGDEPYDHDSNNDGVENGPEDRLSATEIANLKPKAFFYNFVGSGVARFTEKDFIGGAYLFPDETNGLILIGSTKSGGVKNVLSFYENLCDTSQRTIGETLLLWFNEILYTETINPLQEAYGVTLIGDPTLLKSDDPVTISINNATSWLLKQQTLGSDITNPSYGTWQDSVALTSLATLALFNQGQTLSQDADRGVYGPNDPKKPVDGGIRYILRNIQGIDPADYIDVPSVPFTESNFIHQDGSKSFQYAYCQDVYGTNTRTYSTALAIMALAASKNHGYDEIIKRLGNFLVNSQWDYNSIVGSLSSENELVSGIKTFGGFGYGTPNLRADNSNTQFALMGIKIAKDFLANSPDTFMRLELPDRFFAYLLVWLGNTFNMSNGGFGYASQDATPVMSASILWCIPLFYNDYGSYATAFRLLEDGVNPNTNVKEGIGVVDYLKANHAITLGANNTYYHIYTLAKSILLSGHSDIIPEKNWYSYISDILLSQQVTSGVDRGSWSQPSWLPTATQDYIFNTALALLSLELNRIPSNAYSAIILRSHCDLHLYDSKGRHTGANYKKNIIENQIPGTLYKIYRKDTGEEVEYDGGSVDDYPFEIEQVILTKKPVAGNYRIELQGVNSPSSQPGEFHLTLQGGVDDTITTSKTFVGDIRPNEKLSTSFAMTALDGPIDIVTEELQAAPMMELQPTKLEMTVTPGTTKQFSFKIAEIGGKTAIKNIFTYSSKITGTASTIERADFTFTIPSVNVEPSGNMTVTGAVRIPANFRGPAIGNIYIETENGGTQTIEVKLATNVAPLADAGENMTVEASGPTGADVVLDGSGTYDEDWDPLTYEWKWTGGSAQGVSPTIHLPIGKTYITLIAFDGMHYSAPSDVTIIVRDSTPPDIKLIPSFEIEANAVCSAVILPNPLIKDLVDPDPVVKDNRPDCYKLGDTTVTFTATDFKGNSASDSITVTVVDTTPPVLEIPADILQVEAVGPCMPIDIGNATATDIFPVTIINDAPSCYPVGVTVVTWTATDANGNKTSAKQTIEVIDTIKPLTKAAYPADWVTADPAITLTAIDSGSGVKETYYRINGSNWLVGEKFIISTEGTNTIDFYSVDKAGNKEDANTIVVKLDKTAPVTSHQMDGTKGLFDWYLTSVTITLTAKDNTVGADVDKIYYRVNNGSEQIYTKPFIINQSGKNRIAFHTVDKAGNIEAQQTSEVKVIKLWLSDYDLLCNGIKTNGKLNVDRMFVNGSASVNGQYDVHYLGTTASSITKNGPAKIDILETNQPAKPIPVPNWIALSTVTKLQNTDNIYHPCSLADAYFKNGLLIAGGASLKGLIVIKGDFTCYGDVNLNDAAIFCEGKVTLHGKIQGSGLIYSGTNLTVRGNYRIDGTIIVNGALEGSGTFELEQTDLRKYFIWFE